MATTAVERLFVDTNVLVYATNVDSPWQGIAEQCLDDWKRRGVQLCVSVQVLREYLAVTTRRSLGQTAPPDFAAIGENLAAFRANFLVLEDTRPVFEELETLTRQFSVQGRQVHDANIVATLRVFGLRDLLTHNTADFRRYSTLIHVHPLLPAGTAGSAGVTAS